MPINFPSMDPPEFTTTHDGRVCKYRMEGTAEGIYPILQWSKTAKLKGAVMVQSKGFKQWLYFQYSSDATLARLKFGGKPIITGNLQ